MRTLTQARAFNLRSSVVERFLVPHYCSHSLCIYLFHILHVSGTGAGNGGEVWRRQRQRVVQKGGAGNSRLPLDCTRTCHVGRNLAERWCLERFTSVVTSPRFLRTSCPHIRIVGTPAGAATRGAHRVWKPCLASVDCSDVLADCGRTRQVAPVRDKKEAINVSARAMV